MCDLDFKWNKTVVGQAGNWSRAGIQRKSISNIKLIYILCDMYSLNKTVFQNRKLNFSEQNILFSYLYI